MRRDWQRSKTLEKGARQGRIETRPDDRAPLAAFDQLRPWLPSPSPSSSGRESTLGAAMCGRLCCDERDGMMGKRGTENGCTTAAAPSSPMPSSSLAHSAASSAQPIAAQQRGLPVLAHGGPGRAGVGSLPTAPEPGSMSTTATRRCDLRLRLSPDPSDPPAPAAAQGAPRAPGRVKGGPGSHRHRAFVSFPATHRPAAQMHTPSAPPPCALHNPHCPKPGRPGGPAAPLHAPLPLLGEPWASCGHDSHRPPTVRHILGQLRPAPSSLRRPPTVQRSFIYPAYPIPPPSPA